MKTTHTSCVQNPYRPSHKNYKVDDKNCIKLIEVAGWLLILVGLLILVPSAKGDTMTSSDTISPSGVNWTYNWSFTVTFDNLIETSDHINFTGVQNWDRSRLIVGEDPDFDLLTHSDTNHNITMTNLSANYSRFDFKLNGNTSINISGMNNGVGYNIYVDGEHQKIVTSDSNGYLFFYENFTGWKTIEISETGPPTITNQYNNYTADSSTTITVERLNGVEFSATANQIIKNWICYNSTYVSGNGTDTGKCERYFDTNGEYIIKMQGVSYNSNTTENATWSVTVEDTTPPAKVSNLDETTKSQSAITWEWDNPTTADFNHSEIYIDGAYVTTVNNTTTSYTHGGFSCSETHSIEIRTVDFYDNVGSPEGDSTTTTICPRTGGGGGTGGANLAPNADFSYDKVTQYKVSFTDESSDSDGVLADWLWDFGDGDTSTEQSPSHTYSFGTYTVTLTVEDDDGATDSCSEEITIQKVLIKPTATTTAPSAPDYYENLTDVLGGSDINNGTAENPNMSKSFQGFAKTMALPYVGLMGALFFAYAFFLPYMMMWLRQENVIIPTVIGIVLGVTVMLAFAPAQFRLIVMAIIALVLTGRVYLWMRGRA